MSTLGVVVFSLPGMKHLAQCLHSVRWADAVMVLHIGDGAAAMEENPCRALILRRIASLEEVKALPRELKTDWVLHLWGDERIEGEIEDELRGLGEREATAAPSCYRISIRSRILGHWVEGSVWEPAPALRLRGAVEELYPAWWDGRGRASPETPSLRRGWIGDYTFAELSAGVDSLNGLSSLWAQRLPAGGRELNPVTMALLPLRVFLRLLRLNGFYSHGLAGVALSSLAAYAVLLTGAKAWEKNLELRGRRER